jgi:UDPglucose--hexose-1-phosphate uridylyltransferase
MSEFRYNKLTQHWILFAPNRVKRPTNFNSSTNYSHQDIKSCPFELGNESKTPNELARIGNGAQWRCRIVANLYHALSIEVEPKSYKNGCFENKNGFGAHEVIIETPSHTKQMFEFSVDEFFDYFSIINLRLKDLKKDTRIKYFSLFKNFGENGGATLEHSHSQLIATPFIPKTTKKALQFYEKYKKDTERDFFDDLIADEKNFKKGLLFENSSFIAFCPYASRYPFEISIVAKKNLTSLLDFNDVDLYALSEVINFCFLKLNNALGKPAFNMLIKNGDIQSTTNSNRFHIEILPRLYKTAGFELDTDVMVNTFLPETAAEILKES